MEKSKPTSDVFLSYSAADAKFAGEIARILQLFDLSVFDKNALPTGERLEQAVWDAMAESQALVMVVSTAPPSASTIFEIGAAQGWNKPVYVVATDPALMHLPSFLHGVPVYPFSRIEDLARAKERFGSIERRGNVGPDPGIRANRCIRGSIAAAAGAIVETHEAIQETREAASRTGGTAAHVAALAEAWRLADGNQEEEGDGS